MRTATVFRTTTALVTILAALALGEAAAPQEIGTTAAVDQEALGTPPNLPTRTLLVGTDVVSHERVQTSEQGRTQLLFLDESSLNVGPSSDLVLDEFVYDPGAGTGQIAINLGQGLLRYVGGKISKSGNVSVTTANATIGIRGGIFDMIKGPYSLGSIPVGNETLAGHQFGILTCSNGTQREVVRNPSFLCRATPAGIEVIPKPPGWNAAIQALLNGRGDGAPQLPPEEVARAVDLACGSGFGATDPKCQPGLNELPDPFIDQVIGLDDVWPEDLLDNIPVDGGEDGEGGGCDENPDLC
jgi:hypothetical protein